MLFSLISKSAGLRWIGFGWVGFISENLVISENREAIINRIGDENYHFAYNSLSSCACASILYGYFMHRKSGLLLAQAGITRKLGGFVFQSLGCMGLSQLFPRIQLPFEISKRELEDPFVAQSAKKSSNMRWRCPMDFKPADIPSINEIYGLERVSRHSTFWSFGFLCLGEAATAAFLPEVVFFTFPVVFAFIGGWHQDHRFLKGSGGTLSLERYSKTSNIP